MKNILRLISILAVCCFFFVALGCGDTAKEKKDKENKNITTLVVASALTRSSSGPSFSYTGIPTKNAYATSSSVSLTASLSGFTASSFSVSPVLPSGFSLNTTTGAITGTVPSTSQSATNYTVTATSSSSSTLTTTLTIQIVSSSFFCNTSGIATGCSSSQPYSCSNSSFCYSTYASCTGTSTCGY